MEDTRFDGLYMTVAQQQGQQGIEGLLDTFFGFLRRRTDFFTGGGKGLEHVKDTVFNSLLKQAAIVEREEAKKNTSQSTKQESKPNKKAPSNVTSTTSASKSTPKAKEVESDVLEMGPDGTFDATQVSNPAPSASIASSAIDAAAQPVSEPASTTTKPADDASSFSTHNGGRTSVYHWSQTLQELQVNFPVDSALRSRDMDIVITPTRIKVAIRGQKPLLDCELYRRILPDDSSWTLEDGRSGKYLTLYLTKANQMEWWTCVGTGEPEIDVTKVSLFPHKE